MQVSKKSLITVLASTAAICCLSVCRAEQAPPLPPGSTTDSSNPNAPKTIQSKNINSFYFFAEQLGAVTSVDSRGGRFVSVQDHEDFPKNLGICYFSLNRNGAKADFKVSCQNAGRETFKTSGSTDKSALGRLQEIIDRFKVAHLNGFYKRNSALGNAFRLSVTYDSGEKVTAGAEEGRQPLRTNICHPVNLASSSENWSNRMGIKSRVDSLPSVPSRISVSNSQTSMPPQLSRKDATDWVIWATARKDTPIWTTEQTRILSETSSHRTSPEKKRMS